MGHDTVRLEKGGVVVAYFAPNAGVDPIIRNDLRVGARSRSRSPISRDIGLNLMEVNINGRFIHSDTLPSEHKDALETLFGFGPVTPLDQKLRLCKYQWIDNGPFDLFIGDEEFTATIDSEVDILNGIWPQVNIVEIGGPEQGGLEHNWLQYAVKFSVGIQRPG